MACFFFAGHDRQFSSPDVLLSELVVLIMSMLLGCALDMSVPVHLRLSL